MPLQATTTPIVVNASSGHDNFLTGLVAGELLTGAGRHDAVVREVHVPDTAAEANTGFSFGGSSSDSSGGLDIGWD